MEKDIVIYSFFIAKKLVEEGYKLTNMSLNKKYKGKIVFYFEDSKELKQCLKDNFEIDI